MSDIIFWIIIAVMLLTSAGLMANVLVKSRRKNERKRANKQMATAQLYYVGEDDEPEEIKVSVVRITRGGQQEPLYNPRQIECRED